jgi:hypothetical protein
MEEVAHNGEPNVMEENEVVDSNTDGTNKEYPCAITVPAKGSGANSRLSLIMLLVTQQCLPWQSQFNPSHDLLAFLF